MALTRRTVLGIWWSGGARIVKVVSQLVVTIILANLVAPSAFGVLSMATVFTGILMLFSDFGLGAALIQAEQIDDLLIDSCFITNLIVGCVLALLTAIFAPAIGLFYANEQVISVLYVLALNFPILSLGTVQAALLERTLSFKLVSLSEITASLVAALVAIICALLGAQIWSLIIWQLLQSAIRTVALWWFSPYRFRLRFERSRMAKMISFSLHSLGFNLVNYGARNTDNLLIGRLLDASSLGFYTMAYSIMLLPVSNLTAVISRVLFPSFSRKQHDLPALSRGYLRAVSLIALISFPLMTAMFVFASDLVYLFLGAKWEQIVPLIELFVWVGMIQSLLSLNGSVYIALGYVRLRFWLGLAFSIISVAGIIIGLSFGTILSTAIGYTVASFLLLLPGITVPLKLLKISFWCFVSPLLPILISSLGMGLAVWVTKPWMYTFSFNPYLILGLQALASLLIYGGALYFISRSTMSDLLNLILTIRRPANSTI